MNTATFSLSLLLASSLTAFSGSASPSSSLSGTVSYVSNVPLENEEGSFVSYGITGELYLPNSQQPAPAVIIYTHPGSGKILHASWAHRLKKEGFAVLVIEASPTEDDDVLTLCNKAAYHMLHGLLVLKNTPGIDPRRIYALSSYTTASAAIYAAHHLLVGSVLGPAGRFAAVAAVHPVVGSYNGFAKYQSPVLLIEKPETPMVTESRDIVYQEAADSKRVIPNIINFFNSEIEPANHGPL